jgi:uroporphyrinogen decarboxylase
MDAFLVDLADKPDFACGLMDRIADYLLEKAERVLEQSGGRYLMFEYNDDVATQQGLIISPAMWRRHIKPRIARFCGLFQSYGTKVRYHCCGSCYEVIPDLIEIGVDVLNPIQPRAAKMDPFKLKSEFGNDICLHGGVDIQQLLPYDSAGRVYEHVCRLIEVVGRDGGYMLGAGHRIQVDTPAENILAMVEAATGARLRGA